MPIKNIQTAHLVHDLKNPVNIIESGARSLLEKPDRYGALNGRQEKVIRRMLRNALKIRSLANSMLEIDKAALGIVTFSQCTLAAVLRHALVEVFDLVDPAVSDALEESHTFEQFKSILQENDLVLEADEGLLNRPFETDEIKLGLIVVNLLSNAFKYRQKRVHVICQSESDSIFVSVRDDGPGIPDGYHQQIFDQYFQCLPVEGFPVRGHGLGLAGAQALAESLGGKLYLCTTNRGAEFKVEVRCKSG